MKHDSENADSRLALTQSRGMSV